MKNSIIKYLSHLTALRRIKRQWLAVVVDSCIIINAFSLAPLILFEHWESLNLYDNLLFFLPAAVAIQCLSNAEYGLYSSVGRYVGLTQGIKITQASIVAFPFLLLAGFLTLSSPSLQVLVLISIGSMIAYFLMGSVRFYPRIFYERSLREVKRKIRLLIVGAGTAGEMIVRNIQKEPHSNMEVVVLVDDDPELEDLEIHGLPIRHPTDRIPELVRKEDIDEILIAIPSAPLEDFQRILGICDQTDKPTKTIRPLQSNQFGKVGLDHVRDIQIEDVLGRQPVQTDYLQIREFIEGRTVLVTGAGGSIGSELALQISQHNPARVLLVDQDESALYKIHKKLSQLSLQKHEMFVADIKSERKMEALFREHRPEKVFHAAAYKHVPLMELHPDEAVLNNVLGTMNVAQMAGSYGAASFVNISTDKAVEPVNVMGATKYLGEHLVDDLQELFPDTKYRSVRFGNVLGSRGSVIPIFREQILEGGPVTVTHPDMTRYFMLISEAVDLILQTAAFTERNVVYVLDMGKPVNIVDLANQMIGLIKPEQKVDILFTGLRPGEKLHEHLFEMDENPQATTHPMISRVVRIDEAQSLILPEIDELLDAALTGDCERVKSFLNDLIPSYTPFKMESMGFIDSEKEVGQAAIAETSTCAKIPVNLSYKWQGA